MNDYEDEETIIRWLKIEGSVFKDAATINEFGSSELEKLAKDKDANTRLAVAANSRTPVSSLTVLSGDKDDDVRAGVASNPNTPTELLERLAKDSDEVVRWAVAGNPSTPSDSLNLLAQDEVDFVRRAVLENSNSSESILDILDEENQEEEDDEEELEEDVDLSEIIEVNEDKITWISKKFISYSDNEFNRKRAVIYGNKVSPRTLEFLSHDENAIDPDFDNAGGLIYAGVRVAVARHPETPLKVLEALSEDDEPRVVEAVAGNPNTPVHILEKVAQFGDQDLESLREDWEGSTWITLAGNKNLPAYLVEQFAVETNPYLRRVAFDHPKASLESKALASLLGFPKSWTDEKQRSWSNGGIWPHEWQTWDESALEKEMIKALSTLTPERLVELATSSNVNIRRAVSYHPLAPVDLLASDSDELVRYMISKNPFLTPEAKVSIALMGGVLDDDEVIDLEGDNVWSIYIDSDIGEYLFERAELRARVVMSSLENWEISSDTRQSLEEWADHFATRDSADGEDEEDDDEVDNP